MFQSENAFRTLRGTILTRIVALSSRPVLPGVHPILNMPELAVSIRVLRALADLAVPLQAVAHRPQHPPHRGRIHRVPLRPQFGGQAVRALVVQRNGPSVNPELLVRSDTPERPLNPGWFFAWALRPPPLFRCRLGVNVARSSSSFRPLRIVRSAIPVTATAAAIPPRPQARASTAAQRRRPRSSRSSNSSAYLPDKTAIVAASPHADIRPPDAR